MTLLVLFLIGILIFGYQISELLVESNMPSIKYRGNYNYQSFVSAVVSSSLFALFFLLAYAVPFIPCGVHWGNNQDVQDYCSLYEHANYSLDMSNYEIIMPPFILIVLIVEICIRTVRKGNHLIYAILNTFFLSWIPLIIMYALNDIKW